MDKSKRPFEQARVPKVPQKLMNKTFYQFVFSFIAVIAGTMLLILILGTSAGV